VETAVSWKMAVMRGDAPTALVFSRQGLEPMERTPEQVKNIEKGGYILKDCDGTPDLIMIATGSEVGLAMDAAAQMSGKNVRVVSMPSTDVFDEQDQAYRDSVLTPGVKRMAIEAGTGDSWYKYVGTDGEIVCMTTFGESAPAPALFEEFGFTVENVVKRANALIG
jgi:transketolase